METDKGYMEVSRDSTYYLLSSQGNVENFTYLSILFVTIFFILLINTLLNI